MRLTRSYIHSSSVDRSEPALEIGEQFGGAGLGVFAEHGVDVAGGGEACLDGVESGVSASGRGEDGGDTKSISGISSSGSSMKSGLIAGGWRSVRTLGAISLAIQICS